MDGRYSQRRIDLQKIILSSSQKNILKEHALKDSPNESCAILFGNIEEQNTIVKEIFLTKNIENSPVDFTISNEQLIKGYKMAEEKNLDVIAIFHSHPSSDAIPSNTDRKFMETNPVVWIIYSGVTEEFRAYVLDSDVKEIPIQTG